MSAFGKRGPGGVTLGSLQGVYGNERIFTPDMFQVPEAGWPISAAAPVEPDVYSITGIGTSFVDSAETGVGLSLKIPAGVTKMNLRFPGRALDSPASPGVVIMRLYARVGAGVWAGPNAVATMSVPNDLVQSFSFPTLLAPLSLSPGDYAQFLLTRNPLSASDTLTGRWSLYELGVNFA